MQGETERPVHVFWKVEVENMRSDEFFVVFAKDEEQAWERATTHFPARKVVGVTQCDAD